MDFELGLTLLSCAIVAHLVIKEDCGLRLVQG